MLLDAHVHAFPEEVCRRREDFFGDEPAFRWLYESPRSRLLTPEEVMADLADDGVEAAVVMGFPWRRERLWRRHNEILQEAGRRFSQHLIPFCTVNPLEPGAAREVERCLHAGFRGVGELAWYTDDPGDDLTPCLGPVAELCGHYRVPLLLHTNDPLGAPYPGKARLSLPGLYQLIKTFPQVDFILAHWGGGLPFYGLAKKEVPDVLRRVYFDSAASPYLYRPEIYRLAAEMVGPDKILFGSDYPLLPHRRCLAELDQAGLPAPWREMILGGNLARLLGRGL